MIDYENANVQAMIALVTESMMPHGDITGIDCNLSRIIDIQDPMPFSKNEKIAAMLLTDVFGAAGLAATVRITPTSAGNFICEVEGDGTLMVAEHRTPALAIVAALVFSMAEAIGIMA